MMRVFLDNFFSGVTIRPSSQLEQLQEVYSQLGNPASLPKSMKLIDKVVECEVGCPTLARLFLLLYKRKLKKEGQARVFHLLLERNIAHGLGQLESKEPLASSMVTDDAALIVGTKYIMQHTFSTDSLGSVLKGFPVLRYGLSKASFLARFSLPCAYLIKCLSKHIQEELIPRWELTEEGPKLTHKTEELEEYSGMVPLGGRFMKTARQERLEEDDELRSLDSDEEEEGEMDQIWEETLQRETEKQEIYIIN